ncbi:receptor-type tyrosine-protein phosphatase F-like, partial [Actinia tenebrosa]|uniref:Receptor-type tyrosine-protein phosphatase F-like n=1 Tax=Actinia tenebrosa TaxID=6105 RepID=A0A6P8HEZ6_ACTTE
MTDYKFRVLAYSYIGNGISGPAVVIRTSGYGTLLAPQTVVAYKQDAQRIVVEWCCISSCIYLSSITTESSHVLIDGLLPFTSYGVSVTSLNDQGEGASSPEVVVATDESVPSAPPANVRVRDLISTSTIQVDWDPVPIEYANGKVLGYHLTYQEKVGFSNFDVQKPTMSRQYSEEKTDVILQDLTPFTTYKIQVRAFTRKGDGAPSSPINAGTCNCPRDLYTNWASYPPYVNSSLPDGLIGGIFGSFFIKMITDICGTCLNGHGVTSVHFDNDVTGFSLKKETPNEVKSSISDKSHLSFPVNDYVNEEHEFVPIVKSPGIAFITLKDTDNSHDSVLMNIVFQCWPIVVMCLAMPYLAAIVV